MVRSSINQRPTEFVIRPTQQAKASKAFIQHEQRHFFHSIQCLCGNHRIKRHDLLDCKPGKKVVHLVHIKGRSLGGSAFTSRTKTIAMTRLSSLITGKRRIHVLHQFPNVKYWCFGGNRNNVNGHPIAYEHCFLLRGRRNYQGSAIPPSISCLPTAHKPGSPLQTSEH